jgi:hypothetical protein
MRNNTQKSNLRLVNGESSSFEETKKVWYGMTVRFGITFQKDEQFSATRKYRISIRGLPA